MEILQNYGIRFTVRYGEMIIMFDVRILFRGTLVEISRTPCLSITVIKGFVLVSTVITQSSRYTGLMYLRGS